MPSGQGQNGGVEVSCLLDIGSMVTTVTQAFFEQHLKPQNEEQLKTCNWLQLTAANGLSSPYMGYVELDVEVLGKVLPKMGILVVKDSPDPNVQRRKTAVPGLLGMNIISSCYNEIFQEHGNHVLSAPVVKQAGKQWETALSQVQLVERLQDTGQVGEAVSLPDHPTRIPAGSLWFVQATCNQNPALNTVLLEPLSNGESYLPTNILISTAVFSVSKGTVNVPVVNVGKDDQWVRPRTLHLVDVNSSPQIVQVEEQTQDQGRCVAFSYSMTAESPSSSTIPGLNGLNWPDLSPKKQALQSPCCVSTVTPSVFLMEM